jgi:hypothetical protein
MMWGRDSDDEIAPSAFGNIIDADKPSRSRRKSRHQDACA